MNSKPNLRAKDVMVIGQAPPEKIQAVPFGSTRLYKWFAQIGLSQEEALSRFEFAALVDRFPGKSKHGHSAPSQKEMDIYRPQLVALVERNEPKVVIAVGIHAIRAVLNDDKAKLEESVGRAFFARPFGTARLEVTVIPLPHPSGASAWVYLNNNQDLLQKALASLKKALVV